MNAKAGKRGHKQPREARFQVADVRFQLASPALSRCRRLSSPAASKEKAV
jgi:hypothetical protein